MARDIVILVNRTSNPPRPLQYMFDGSREILQPGENHGIERRHMQYAIEQNKIMGTEEMYAPNQFESLVGVKTLARDGRTWEEHKKWKCSPAEQTDEPQAINRKAYNRRTGKTSKVIPGDGPTQFDAMMPGGNPGIGSNSRD